MVRAPVQGWTDRINPNWLLNGIVFTRTERHIRQCVLGSLSESALTGCVVITEALVPYSHLLARRAILVVPDQLKAVRSLAVAARSRMRGKVALVTGSVGKTTTRTMLAHVLRRQGRVITNLGNLNLRGYVFQYMASAPADCDFASFELGLGGARNAFGDVSDALQPDVVVLTQLAIAHLDRLSGAIRTEEDALRAIADQKLQLTRSMRPEGAVVINTDIPLFEELSAKLGSKGRRIVSFGDNRGDFQLLHAESNGKQTAASIQYRGERIDYTIKLPAKFMAMNSLAALVAAGEMGADVRRAAQSLSTFRTAQGRAQVLDLSVNGCDFKLIDDSFNATALSVRSTFEVLGSFTPTGNGRRIAILGDIAHLGKDSPRIHGDLAEAAVRSGVDLVYTYGEMMKHLHNALPEHMAAGHFSTRKAILETVLSDLRTGDVITVKASIPSGFRHLISGFKRVAVPLNAGSRRPNMQAGT